MTQILRWFPDMQKGESLYSVFGKYAEEMDLERWGKVSRVLFGKSGGQPSLLFFPEIGRLSSLLPPTADTSTGSIINRHTGTPILQLSTTSEEYSTIISEMINGSSIKKHCILSYEERQMHEPYQVKYCPLCLSKDGHDKIPRIYIVHQFQSVDYCPIHECKLTFVKENSSLEYFQEINPKEAKLFGHVRYPSSKQERMKLKLSKFFMDCLRNH